MSLAEAVMKKAQHLQSWCYGDLNANDADDALGEYDNLLEYVEAVEAENRDLRARLADVETQLNGIQDLGREKTTKEEKVAALVQYAQNLATDAEADRVVLERETVKGVAGVSRRYSYTFIDDLADDYAWLLNRADISQYGDLELDKDGQTKALVVDLGELHTDDQAVSKFITRTDEEAASV